MKPLCAILSLCFGVAYAITGKDASSFLAAVFVIAAMGEKE